MDRWTEFQVFVKIAEEKSLPRAALELNLSVSAISRNLASFEASLRDRLIQRST
ncbi:helix-turn-helix domain-containing protein [Agrobacterium rosae]|uniref:helix-turn-helix domain-containing protein n=1 Tax=Agrobacterium rosae TaxID=1972867 RepID=UPI003BA1472E